MLRSPCLSAAAGGERDTGVVGGGGRRPRLGPRAGRPLAHLENGGPGTYADGDPGAASWADVFDTSSGR